MVNYRTVVLSRPVVGAKYEIPITTYTNYWSRLVVDKARELGITIEVIGKSVTEMTAEEIEEGNNVTREQVESALKNFNPILYCDFGHGDTDRLVASNPNEYLIKTDENMYLLKGRIVYAFACLSARELGRKAVENGCLSYCGYDESIYCVMYCEDGVCSTADGNEETATKFPLELLNGKTTGEAYKSALEEYDYWIKYWYGKDPNCYSQFSWNKQHMVLLGSQTATIISPLETTLNTLILLLPVVFTILILEAFIKTIQENITKK